MRHNALALVVSFFLVFLSIGMGVRAYTITSTDSCGLYDCCSILAMKDYTVPQLSTFSATKVSDLRAEIGKIDFKTVKILDASHIEVCGKIEGGTQNYWGISGLWNSTWWNSSYPYRYPFYLTRNDTAQIFSVNDSAFLFNRDIYWTNISNQTKNYVYCINSGCTSGDIKIGQETMEIFYHNETNGTGNTTQSIYDTSYQMVLHMNNVTGTDFAQYKQAPTSAAGVFPSDNIIFGKGLNFTGTDGFQYSGANCFNHTGAFTAWTVEMWVSTASLSAGADEKYMWRGDSEEIRAKLGENLDAGNQLFCSQFNGTWTTLKATIAKNVTYYVVCRWNGTALGLFVNGAEVASAPMPTFTASTGGCAIGSQMGGQEFKGWIDEFRVSNISRSNQYISDQYANGIGLLTYFGSEEALDVTPPNITIYHPENKSYDWDDRTNFLFNISVAEALPDKCVFWLINTSLTMTGDMDKSSNWYTRRFNLTNSWYNATFICNDTSANNATNGTFFSIGAAPPNTTAAFKQYCNDTILKKDYFYNEYTGSYVNLSENCTYGCDDVLIICKPNPTYSFLIVCGILLIMLVIATYIKRNWV